MSQETVDEIYSVDPRVVNELEEIREEKRRRGLALRMQPLLDAISRCRATGDTALHGAIRHWIDSLRAREWTDRGRKCRMDLSCDRKLNLPAALQHALGLETPAVLLRANGEVWSPPIGTKMSLLYSPAPVS